MAEGVPGRPFVKGESGNPAGRPRAGTPVAEYIRQLAGPNARAYIDELHWLATSEHKDTRARLTAIQILMERGYGKPPEVIDSPPPMTFVPVSQLSDHQLEVLEEALLKAGVPAT